MSIQTSQHNLIKALATRISGGLRRQAIASCSKWAETYRILGGPTYPGPWSFNHHPWLRAMHDAPEEWIVGRKAAQMGYTEVALNRTFYAIDILAHSVLYVLPASTPDASDFSTSRFDPALELSSHLTTLFSDVKNIGHKRAGTANLFIRGSRSRSQLKSIPVSDIVLDELNEMVQDNIPLALERQAGQLVRSVFMISTPTLDNVGIDLYYGDSSQDHYFFKCPHCSRYIELVYPESLVIVGEDLRDAAVADTHVICTACKKTLTHETKNEWLNASGSSHWVPSFKGRARRGFYINQMYSPTLHPSTLAATYLKGLVNPASEQEFYNSKMGMPHIVEGARLNDTDIDACSTNHRSGPRSTGNAVTMGVDVGKWLHYEITEWVPLSRHLVDNDISLSVCARVLQAGRVAEFEELNTLLSNFGVRFTVIDANPERRKALEFARRYYGRVNLCFYTRGITGKSIRKHSEAELAVSVDRTSWLDCALGRFKNRTIQLPQDIPFEYRAHMKALTKVYENDVDGNPVARYLRGQDQDHSAHARVYSEIALSLISGTGSSHDLTDIY